MRGHVVSISADSAARPVVASRQTREGALGLALNYIHRAFSAIDVRDATTGASYGERSSLILGHSGPRTHESDNLQSKPAL